MAKNIDDGVSAITRLLREQQDDQRVRAWRDLRNKLDSLLLSGNVLKTDDSKRFCLQMDEMDIEQRKDHILRNWGPQYLQRCEPMLHQLNQLEGRIAAEEGVVEEEEAVEVAPEVEDPLLRGDDAEAS